jgi:hypothetical protein
MFEKNWALKKTLAVLAKFRANAAQSLKADAVGELERAVQQLLPARDLKPLSAALRQTN